MIVKQTTENEKKSIEKIRKVACEIFKKNWANWKIEITKTEKYRRVVALRAILKKSHSKFMSQLPKKKQLDLRKII